MERDIKTLIKEAEFSMRKRFPHFSGDEQKAFETSTLFININSLGIVSLVVLAVSLAFQAVFLFGLSDLSEYLGRARQVLILNRLVISVAAAVFLLATFGKMKYKLSEGVLKVLSLAMPVFYLWVMAFFSVAFQTLDLGLVPYLGMQFVIVALIRIPLSRAIFIFVPPLAFLVVYEWLTDENAVQIAVNLISIVVVSAVSIGLSQVLYLFWRYQFHFMVLIQKQSDDLQNANETLKRLASMDGLTGIGNRRSFDEKLQYEWGRARREKEKLALIMIDIDHFKLYNDTYGHQKGDEALKAVAGIIQGTLKRSIDFAARYGGEEFVVLLPMATVNGACEMAEKIREAVLSLKIEHRASRHGYVTISLGVICMGPESLESAESLLAAADIGLYTAKQTGRNKYFCQNPELN